MIKVLAGLCYAGSLCAFGIGTLGLYRLPDPYNRIHGLSISDTLGVGLAGLGLLLTSPHWMLRVKLLFILAFFWIINPTMTHLVVKAGLLGQVPPVQGTKLMKR
ncbi:MAG TPA: monovalent cation/H(+) antiporter subunit G [Firmicutes bacterium]|nr:monovalent cation/H(+) antiporter subunit G [Bacillota bacterium]